MLQIEITGATGTGPYTIYVCDTTLTYCELVGSGINIPPNFIYTLNYPLDNVNSVIVKVIDSNDCEFIQLYNCEIIPPSPSPTPTPTPTPTNTECNCISFENPTISNREFSYTQCNGEVFYGLIYGFTTLYVCGKLPSADPLVNISVGLPCVDGSCFPIPTPLPD